MRDRRVKGQLGDPPDQRPEPGTRRWVLVIAAICALWLAAMVVASYLGLEHKSPVRIENWRPEPSDR
jgi:hypothetical protein